MLTDAFTRLSGTVGTTPAPQSIAAATAATPLLSTNWVDLATADYPYNGNLGDGDELFARFLFVAPVTSGTATGTLECQLITMPRTTAAGVVFTAATFATDDRLASAAHGFPEGTLLVLTTATTLPAGLALATPYFVRNPTEDSFEVSLTPGGAVVAVTSAGTGAHTATAQPTIVASSGPVPKDRCAAGDSVTLRSNPLWQSRAVPKHRYLFARYVVSANLTGGSAYCDVGMGPADQRHVYHRSGFVVQ